MASRTVDFCCLVLMTCLLFGTEAYFDPSNATSTIEPTETVYLENGARQKVTFTCKAAYTGEAPINYCFSIYRSHTRCSDSNTFTYAASYSVQPLAVSSINCRARYNGTYYFTGTPVSRVWLEKFSDQVDIVTLDKPETPTISSNNIQYEDGDMIQLGCHTNTSYAGEYEDDFRWTWKLNGDILTTGPDNVYNISKDEIGDLAGDYTCLASIGQVSSNESDIFTLC